MIWVSCQQLVRPVIRFPERRLPGIPNPLPAKEKCQKIVKEQEFKIRKLKEKLAGIAPTKKNKAAAT